VRYRSPVALANDPLGEALLAFGGLGLRLSLGLPQPSQPLVCGGQRLGQLIPAHSRTRIGSYREVSRSERASGRLAQTAFVQQAARCQPRRALLHSC
jgi:hypothetical protein